MRHWAAGSAILLKLWALSLWWELGIRIQAKVVKVGSAIGVSSPDLSKLFLQSFEPASNLSLEFLFPSLGRFEGI